MAKRRTVGNFCPRQNFLDHGCRCARYECPNCGGLSTVFHEQQMLESNCQTLLESQLQGGLTLAKDFVRKLKTSSPFCTWNYEVNNYRFVEL